MEELRRLLITYAYNILGSMEDARDVVQDCFLKYSLIDQLSIIDKRSYLIRMVVNLSIDQKKKRKAALRTYPGEWLPEPIATDTADGALNSKEILGYSVMVLLEKLSARHRAVFILKEAFDYSHEEIASVLGISAGNSRKILERARELVHQQSVPEQVISITDYAKNFVDLIRKGDIDQLEQIFNREIEMISDGGGKAKAALNPLYGTEPVRLFIMGIFHKFYLKAAQASITLNHQPAIIIADDNGQISACLILTILDQKITNIFILRNPDKLEPLKKYLPVLSHF